MKRAISLEKMAGVLTLSTSTNRAMRKLGIGVLIGFLSPVLAFALFGACFTWFAGPWLFHQLVDPYGVPERTQTQFKVWGVLTGALGLILGIAFECLLLTHAWGWKIFSAMGFTGALIAIYKV